VSDYIEIIVSAVIRRTGDRATALISALIVRLAILKKLLGLGIALFSSHAKQASVTRLNTVLQRIPG
jgi:hypothetical protein